MRPPISYHGQIRDCEYLQARGATFMQQIAWLVWHPRGGSSKRIMDTYLQGGHP